MNAIVVGITYEVLIMKLAKIGVIGNGNVGGALVKGLSSAGYEVQAVGNNVDDVRRVSSWADIVVLAVPFTALNAVADIIRENIIGKVIVDATNALDSEMNLALGFTSSGAETLQKNLFGSYVVKAFNTVFAQHMASGSLDNQKLTSFVSSDHDKSKEVVIKLATDIGFDAIDAGPLKNARLLEPMAYFNIQLGYVLGMGTQIGLKLIHD
jgi:predicted dinucleotide-binding enzyme